MVIGDRSRTGLRSDKPASPMTLLSLLVFLCFLNLCCLISALTPVITQMLTLFNTVLQWFVMISNPLVYDKMKLFLRVKWFSRMKCFF